MSKVDINVDIAEGFPWDAELVKVATSANVCCGAHAGSPELAEATFEMCQEAGVRIGLHPGYPDRASMSRASVSTLDITEEALVESLWRQVERFIFVASYIKPHGALYHDANSVPMAARALTLVLSRCRLSLMGLPQSRHSDLAAQAGVAFIREGFADRRYDRAGRLVPRSEPDALLTDPQDIERQVSRLAGSVDTICVHGDGDDPVSAALAVRRALVLSGCEVGW